MDLRGSDSARKTPRKTCHTLVPFLLLCQHMQNLAHDVGKKSEKLFLWDQEKLKCPDVVTVRMFTSPIFTPGVARLKPKKAGGHGSGSPKNANAPTAERWCPTGSVDSGGLAAVWFCTPGGELVPMAGGAQEGLLQRNGTWSWFLSRDKGKWLRPRQFINISIYNLLMFLMFEARPTPFLDTTRVLPGSSPHHSGCRFALRHDTGTVPSKPHLKEGYVYIYNDMIYSCTLIPLSLSSSPFSDFQSTLTDSSKPPNQKYKCIKTYKNYITSCATPAKKISQIARSTSQR